MAADTETVPDRSVRGWKLGALLIAPYLVIQFVRQVARDSFPDWLSAVDPEDAVPFRDWFNDFVNYLRNEDFLGLFSFRDFTRRVSGWLEWPLELSERLFVAGDRIDPRGWVNWIVIGAVVMVAGAVLSAGRRDRENQVALVVMGLLTVVGALGFFGISDWRPDIVVLVLAIGAIGAAAAGPGRETGLRFAAPVAAVMLIDQLVGAMPWVMVVLLFALVGVFLGGWRLGALSGSCILYLALFDVWEDSMITLAFVAVAAPIAATFGWLLGLGGARSRTIESILGVFLNVLQSMPQLSYLLPISAFVGIGDEAGLIAMIIFATAPMARLTMLGLQTVSSEVLEAGIMSGTTKWQQLFKVELPAAKPQLMVGVNQVIMQSFGMTVLASFVGMRGLGLPLLNFLQSLRIGNAFELGVAIVLMAITLDRLSQAAGAREPGQQGFGRRLDQFDLRRGARLGALLMVPAAIAAVGGFNWIQNESFGGDVWLVRDLPRIFAGLPMETVGRWFPAFLVLTVFAVGVQALGESRHDAHDTSVRLTSNRRYLGQAGAISIVSIVFARLSDRFQLFPENWTVDTAAFWDAVVRWPRDDATISGFLRWLRDEATVHLLIPMRDGFQAIPWIGLLVLVGVIAWRLGGPRLTATVGVWSMFLALSGLWLESLETAYLVIAGLVLAVIIGVPIGIVAAGSDRLTTIVNAILDTFQVLPSFIYLIPAVMLFSVGAFSSLFAILIYATVPAVRYTILGLRNVPEDKIEAALTSGCTPWQTLWKVRMPLAFPEIMLGMNQVLNFGALLVIIAAFIGGIGGLGDVILVARTEVARAGESILAGLCVVAMLQIADSLISAYAQERKAQLGLVER